MPDDREQPLTTTDIHKRTFTLHYRGDGSVGFVGDMVTVTETYDCQVVGGDDVPSDVVSRTPSPKENLT